jgi:parvulin-like peptidyl-prolyl isomerase
MASNFKRTGTLYYIVFVLAAGVALLPGCRANPTELPTQPPEPATATLPAEPTGTPTPTVTPAPMAAVVNGEGIPLAEYELELRQLKEAHQALQKNASEEEQRQQVLDNLIDTLLLAQGAFESGYTIDDAALQAEVDRIAGEMGGAQALSGWLEKNGYSQAQFYAVLRRQMAAAWQRDALAKTVPAAAEQIHARQILSQDEEIANRALEQVKVPGVNFAAQAYRYDPVTGGDLGWFPRGYLTQPEVEEAAFQLQPGEISPVIKSQIGFHIVQVISREPSRALSPDALRVLQHKAVEAWLQERRANSQVEVEPAVGSLP